MSLLGLFDENGAVRMVAMGAREGMGMARRRSFKPVGGLGAEIDGAGHLENLILREEAV